MRRPHWLTAIMTVLALTSAVDACKPPSGPVADADSGPVLEAGTVAYNLLVTQERGAGTESAEAASAVPAAPANPAAPVVVEASAPAA